MKSLLRWIDNSFGIVFERARRATCVSDDALSRYRIVVGVVMLTFLMPSWAWIADMPPAFFEPPMLSLAAVFNGFPPPVVIALLQIAVVVLLVLFTLGVRARWMAFGIFAVSVVATSFYYSFGKIDHKFLGIALFAFLGFTNCGATRALLPDKRVSESVQRGSLAILAICLCFGMVTAGLPKAGMWIDFDLSTSGILHWHASVFNVLSYEPLLGGVVANIPPLLMECTDYLIVFLEVSGILFLLLGATYWRIWLLVLGVFHLMNALVLGIPFQEHVLVYGVFLFAPLLSTRESVLDRLVFRRWFVVALIAVAVVHLAALAFEPFRAPATSRYAYTGAFLWAIALPFGLAGIARGALRS